MPLFIAPTKAQALLYHKKMSHGRNSPILISAISGANEVIQCVVKLPWKMQGFDYPQPYLFEWLSSALANRLGIATPEPYEIELSPLFLDRLPVEFKSPTQKDQVVFGSKMVGTPYTQPAKSDILNLVQLRSAASLLAFDLLIQNPDRRIERPNLFVCSEGFLAYDHELAFSFLFDFNFSEDNLVLFAQDECSGIVKNHFLRTFLKKRSLDIQKFQQELATISNQEIDDLLAVTPNCWKTGKTSSILNTLAGYLRQRRDSFPLWWKQVESCLNA